MTWMKVLMVALLSGLCAPATAQVTIARTTAIPLYTLPAAGLRWPSASTGAKAPHFALAASFEDGFKLPPAKRSPVQRVARQPARLSPDAYYTNCYGLFCKLEWMTQQTLHIPLSLRLGDAAYEKRLERGE